MNAPADSADAIHGAHPDRPADRAAIVGLFLLVMATFWPALQPNGVFFERDIGNYWYPQVEARLHAVAEGAWPVWSPRFGFGEAMWGDPSYQVSYPPAWLNVAFPPGVAFKVFVLAHALLAVLGFYAFARTEGLRPLASFAGAAACGLSGPFLSAANLHHHFAGAAWIPAVLFALARALRRGTGAPLLAAVVALQMLAGSAEVIVMTALLALAYVLSFVSEGPWRPRLLRAVRLAPAALLVAIALSAVLWLPTASLVGVGSRLLLPRAQNLTWSVHPLSLLDLAIPRFVADLPLTPKAAQRLGMDGGSFLNTLHLGVPALALALLALRHPARALRHFALVAFVFFLLLALGDHTPILPALLPFKPFALFRYPAKYLLAAAVACAALTALGVDGWLRTWERRERWCAGAVATCLALLAAIGFAEAHDPSRLAGFASGLIAPDVVPAVLATLQLRISDAAWLCAALAGLVTLRAARPTWSEATAIAAVALLAVTVVGVGRTTYVLAPSAVVRARPQIVSALASVGGRRVQVESPPFRWTEERLKPVPAGWNPFAWSFLGVQERLAPPTGSRWGLDGSFDADFTGLSDRSLTLLSRVFNALGDGARRTRLLQIGAVDHVVTLDEPTSAGLRELARIDSVYTLPIRLFAVPDPLPRAYLVGRTRSVADESALGALMDPSFDFRREVLLSDGAPGLTGGSAFEGTARETERRSDRVTLEVEANAPAVLVLVETFDSGWRATLDGEPARVERANAAFRAVRVPAGRHRVEMRYRPPSVALGLATSAAALLGWLLWQFLGSRPSFSDRPSPR